MPKCINKKEIRFSIILEKVRVDVWYLQIYLQEELMSLQLMLLLTLIFHQLLKPIYIELVEVEDLGIWV